LNPSKEYAKTNKIITEIKHLVLVKTTGFKLMSFATLNKMD
jgi:hypothetical protein